jgi:hypothetical protein
MDPLFTTRYPARNHHQGTTCVISCCSDTDHVFVFLGDGVSNFGGVLALDAGDAPFDVGLIDINDDGDVDILATNLGSDNISVFLGDGEGSFEGALFFTAGDGRGRCWLLMSQCSYPTHK